MATSPRKVQLVRIAHVYYKYPDLEEAKQFFLDFGFTEEKRISNDESGGDDEKIYFRGYGAEPWVLCATKSDKPEFGGAAFVVESEEDLRIATMTLPNASGIYELEDAPGGGRCVTFHDPVDGWPMHLVHGQRSADMLDIPLPQTPVNYIVHDAENIDRTAFCRLDRGEEEVDHHVFFFAEGPVYNVHHSSYETHDFDTQVLGHDWLREKGYRNCWGVGRHVLGSQIFDYWFDPSGFIFEHYVDGDLVNADEPTHRSQDGPGSLHVWGPDVPSAFLE
ncbi:hypothetical protein CHU98_g2239 [Xylaria longipes]|nr:hypothetical protein CHU98_g2239 [Xylaria longipes]